MGRGIGEAFQILLILAWIGIAAILVGLMVGMYELLGWIINLF